MNAATVTRMQDGLTVTRRFAAPRELVFRAFSEAEQLAKWWGPPAFPVETCTVDFREGGVWHYSLRGRDGSLVWARSVYREIRPPERVAYHERSSDAEGNVTLDRPSAFVTVTFESDGGADTEGAATEGTEGIRPRSPGTVLTVRIRYQSPLDRDLAIRYGVERGLSLALDQLDAVLAALLTQKETA